MAINRKEPALGSRFTEGYKNKSPIIDITGEKVGNSTPGGSKEGSAESVTENPEEIEVVEFPKNQNELIQHEDASLKRHISLLESFPEEVEKLEEKRRLLAENPKLYFETEKREVQAKFDTQEDPYLLHGLTYRLRFIDRALELLNKETAQSVPPPPPAPPRRTVDEMLASATVKRIDFGENLRPREELTEKNLKGKLTQDVLRSVTSFNLPEANMLESGIKHEAVSNKELMDQARQLAEKCVELGAPGTITRITPGPAVTTFEFKPNVGIKYSKVLSLVDDLALALKVESVRLARIPGKDTIGIEVPNSMRDTVGMREVIKSRRFQDSPSELTLALGKTSYGENYVTDLKKEPHLLIGAQNEEDKSALLHSILLSLLYKASPNELKLLMVDPRRHLKAYEGIPHLVGPIITEAEQGIQALEWARSEMDDRYKHLSTFGVRNIDTYNSEIAGNYDPKIDANNPDKPKPLPYMVIVIDELEDLMNASGRKTEEYITPLASMARAVGIHLVVATRDSSVNTISGLIKANFPSRIALRTPSKVDSRAILDTNDAATLLGEGDMLVLPEGTSRLTRVQGASVSEEEVKRVCDFLREQNTLSVDEKPAKTPAIKPIIRTDLGTEDTERWSGLVEEPFIEKAEMKSIETSNIARAIKHVFESAKTLGNVKKLSEPKITIDERYINVNLNFIIKHSWWIPMKLSSTGVDVNVKLEVVDGAIRFVPPKHTGDELSHKIDQVVGTIPSALKVALENKFDRPIRGFEIKNGQLLAELVPAREATNPHLPPRRAVDDMLKRKTVDDILREQERAQAIAALEETIRQAQKGLSEIEQELKRLDEEEALDEDREQHPFRYFLIDAMSDQTFQIVFLKKKGEELLVDIEYMTGTDPEDIRVFNAYPKEDIQYTAFLSSNGYTLRLQNPEEVKDSTGRIVVEDPRATYMIFDPQGQQWGDFEYSHEQGREVLGQEAMRYQKEKQQEFERLIENKGEAK